MSLTKLAVWWLCRQLRKDKGYYIGREANIAVCMYDGLKEKYPTLKMEHCKISAKNFLELSLAKPTGREDKNRDK